MYFADFGFNDRSMYTHDARALGRCHLTFDRRRRLLPRLGFARLLNTLLGFARFADVCPGNDDTPRKSARGRVGRRVPPLVAVHGQRRRGRRRQTLRVFVAFSHDLVRRPPFSSFRLGYALPRLTFDTSCSFSCSCVRHLSSLCLVVRIRIIGREF